MGGALVASISVIGLRTIFKRPVGLATVWAFAFSAATVAVAGYAVELNEGFFGGGDRSAAGAANDAIFTWFHQDVGLFLLPSIVLVMLTVQLLIGKRRTAWIGWFSAAGTTAIFAGGMVWVFVNPDLYGSGYVLSTLGLLVVGTAILGTLYHGVLGHRPLPASGAARTLRGSAA